MVNCVFLLLPKRKLYQAATSKNQIITPKISTTKALSFQPFLFTYSLIYSLTYSSHFQFACSHTLWHLQTSLIRLIVWTSNLHLYGQQLSFNSLLSAKNRRQKAKANKQQGRKNCFLKISPTYFWLIFILTALSSVVSQSLSEPRIQQSNLLTNKTNISLRAFLDSFKATNSWGRFNVQCSVYQQQKRKQQWDAQDLFCTCSVAIIFGCLLLWGAKQQIEESLSRLQKSGQAIEL